MSSSESLAGAKPIESVDWIDSPGKWVPTGLLVCVGYYAGAQLGLALTFSPYPISVLWPPNAILLAALLLTPSQRWFIVALAALPAHLLAELQGGIPPLMVVCWYVSNVLEALIGAVCVSLLVRGRLRFDSPRNAVAFILAVFVAALLSSFVDSGFVALNGWGEAGFWDNWNARLWSNVTAGLTITSAIVALATERIPSPEQRRARLPELAILLACLLLVTIVVFDTGITRGLTTAQICLPLPFLLWATLRFGPAGASVSFAVMAFVAIWGAGHGTGALGMGSPVDNARSVQVFLIAVGPTLLCLAAALRARRDIEESLRLSDKRFRVVLEATRDSVYERQLDTGRMWWAPDGLKQFGYEPADGHPAYEHWLDMVHPDDRERLTGQREHAMRNGEQLWQSEFRLRLPDGTHAHVREQGFIVRDTRGRPVQLIGSLTRVADRPDSEAFNQRLAQASRMTSMGELTASIAHEINQPMAAIVNNVEAACVLLDAGMIDQAGLKEILADIREDGLRTGETIRRIRDLASKRGTRFEFFELNELVANAMRLLLPAASRRHIVIRTELGPVPMVRADRVQLQQVLLNLAINAMDAMDGLAAGPREIVIRTHHVPQANRLELAVTDRGHGIPPERLEKIFESFYTTKGEGMGLGLSIARSIVRAHHGSIWAENNPGGGATFRFTLPLKPGP